MKVEKFVTGIISTNCYLFIQEQTGQTVVIDPAACPPYLMSHIKSKGLRVEAILLTHAHFDHTMGVKELLKDFNVPVYLHPDDEEMMRNPVLNLSQSYTSGYTGTETVAVKDGETLLLAGCEIQVLHTPGHTKGGVCYYIASEKLLFSGDTLFQSSVGRTDFPGSSMSALISGIKEKLMVLPEDVSVYPGHMGETTIGYEKEHNPFL